MTRFFPVFLLFLCGCFSILGKQGLEFENVPSSQEYQFEKAIEEMRNRTAFDMPKYWKVEGRAGTKEGKVCGVRSFAFNEQGLWCVGLTTGNRSYMTTILSVAPDKSYCLPALYHEALQGLGYANGKIPPDDDHPDALRNYLPEQYRCAWR